MKFFFKGTSNSTNPIAMQTIFKNTIFTNVASTSDGGVYWEGMENEVTDDVKFIDWLGKEWSKGSKTPAAHPNSRYFYLTICIFLLAPAKIQHSFSSVDFAPQQINVPY